MLIDLALQLFVTTTAAEESQETHPYLSPMTRPMARAICCQRLRLDGELFFARGGQLVELRLAVVLAGAPGGREPAAIFEAMQRGIERALLDLQHIFGGVFDDVGDGMAVCGPMTRVLRMSMSRVPWSISASEVFFIRVTGVTFSPLERLWEKAYTTRSSMGRSPTRKASVPLIRARDRRFRIEAKDRTRA